MAITAQFLADQLSLPLKGQGDTLIDHVALLGEASQGALSFVGDNKYLKLLPDSQASVVLLKPEHAELCPCTAILSPNPYAAYAVAARLLYPVAKPPEGIHPSAVLGQDTTIHPSVSIQAQVVIGDQVTIGRGCCIGAGSIIESGVTIGEDTRLAPRVTLKAGVSLGHRCVLHSGVVVGSDGFGFTNDHGRWLAIPQVGSVCIGNDVDIGANTTIDRGAIENTVIEDGVKLDNLIQIGHNVRIGEHTVIAACSGVAGSAQIGKHCMIGGSVGIVGHLRIADHAVITGQTFVAHNIDKPGSYSSGVPMQETAGWRRNYARFRQLDDIAKRLKKIERKLKE